MRAIFASVLVVVAACGDDGGSAADAPHPDPAIDAAIDAPPPTALTHTLFLATEGVAVTPGADDATANTTSLVPQAVTIGAYLVGASDRDTQIATLASDLAAVVAPYDITVTTTRPAAGPYTMVIATDDPSTGVVGTGGVTFITPQTCTPADESASEIGIVFGFAGRTGFDVEHDAIAMFGSLQQIPGTAKPGDCMCWNCGLFDATCTIGGAATPTAPGGPNCGGAQTIDEQAAFLATFGPHP